MSNRSSDTPPADRPAEPPPDSPHYPINATLRRRLQTCYDHGSKLVNPGGDYDFDYANTMFTECVVRDPNNLVYVDAFLDNLQRKFKNNKKGGRFMGFGGGRGPLKKAIAQSDWSAVLDLSPTLLKTNPWDVPTLRALAQACEAFGYNEVELRYLRNALDANPKDPDVNRHCALSLARMGQFDQSIVCWHRVEEAKKNDPEAPRMISELTVEKARAQSGYGTDDLPTSKSNKPQPSSDSIYDDRPEEEAAPKRREIQLSPRQVLEKAIVDFPTDVENYLKLSELHLLAERFKEAELVLGKAMAASGGDIKVRERMEDATVLRMRYQLSVAEKRADIKQTSESKDLVEQIRSNLTRLEMEICHSRAQRYPDDQSLKYQLGKRLKRLGKFNEALEQFQQISEPARELALARLEQGECLQHLKKYPPSLRAYQESLAAADAPEQVEVRKLALYRASVLATALRQRDTAERYLRQLLSLEPEYKDAASRLDKLKEIGNN